MPNISIIIPNLNGEDFMPQCLQSLKTSIDVSKTNVEIILVDNASSDTSPEIFTSFCQKHKIKHQLISLTKNYGFAGAVNRGVETSKSDWVLVCNNDLKMDKNWLLLTTPLLTSHLFNYSSTPLAAITGTVLNYEGSRLESQGLKFYYSGKCDNISNGEPFSPTYLKHYSSSQLVWGASAALTTYNKKIFNKVGGFDEDFFAYLEDVDLSFRLNKAGYKTIYVPQAISYHLGGGTTSLMGNFRQRQTVKNWIYIILKNYSSSQLLIYFPLIFIERLRNLSGLIKNTPLKNIPRDVLKTYVEVWKNRKKMKTKNIYYKNI